jgi:hypothetical protein
MEDTSMDKTKDMVQIEFETNDYCTCDRSDITAHTCPFRVEIDEDYEFKCECCPYCENECRMNI